VPSQVESDVGRRTRTYARTFTASVQLESGTALGRSGLRNWSECTLLNLRLPVRRKRSNPEYEDVQLLAMAIDPIEDALAADDLIVEDDSD
jgi:hypothetical protein